MFSLALKNLRTNRSRFVATFIAVLVGVAFLSAGLMLTDAIRNSLGGELATQYRAVAVAVEPTSDLRRIQARIPPEVLDQVRAVDGVRDAVGELSGRLRILLRDERVSVTGRLWSTVADLNPLEITEGRAPRGTGEIAIDRATAADRDMRVGATLSLATNVGERHARIVGLTSFGSQDRLDATGTVSIAAADRTWLAERTSGYDRILASGPTQGAANRRLVSDVRSAVASGFTVVGHQKFVDDASSDASAFADFLRPVLIGFAALAMFVCAFVIYNTFSVIVVQRIRELALLRAIGATPRDVRRSTRFEGAALGLIGSVAGLAGGLGIVWLIRAVAGAFDVRLPGGAELTVGTTAVCIGTGVIVTLASVWIPARRAARTAPIEALRSGYVDTTGRSRPRRIISVALMVVGAVGLLVGGFATEGLVLGLGALAFTVGLIVAGPLLADGFARAIKPILRRRGVATRLAVDNSIRNPRRTATTANALVIGVLLVTLVTTAGGTLRDYVVAEINKITGTDFIVGAGFSSAMQPSLINKMRTVPGVTSLATIRYGLLQPDESKVGGPFIAGGDPRELRRAAKLKVSRGSLDNLGEGQIAVVEAPSGGGFGGGPIRQLHVGDPFTATKADGTPIRLEVGAELKFGLESILVGNLVDNATFTRLFGEKAPSSAFISVDPARRESVNRELQRLVRPYSEVEVTAGNSISQAINTAFDVLINAVNGLLGMSVLIALVGIVNTMSLSVFERRREIGLLRAIGMTRRDVRRMVRAESLIIALLGTVVGIVAGNFISFCLTRYIQAGAFSFEWARLGLIAVIGVLLGLVASLWPTRRVNRIEMIDALAAE